MEGITKQGEKEAGQPQISKKKFNKNKNKIKPKFKKSQITKLLKENKT